MRIGDRVRALHGDEEGTVVNFQGESIVEIEIEDGFTIPMLKKDLVVISEQEDSYFRKPQPTPSQSNAPALAIPAVKEQSLLLAFVPINDREVQLHLINSHRKDCFVVVNRSSKNGHKALFHGEVSSQNTQKLFYWKLPDFETWPSLTIQYLFINEEEDTLPETKNSRIKFKSSVFFKSKRKLPILSKEGYNLRIDESFRTIDAESIKQSLFQQSEEVEYIQPKKSITGNGGQHVIDLHIEELTTDFSNLENEEILRIQLEHFQKALDKALISGADSLKIIHGVGNGVLRNEVQQIISQLDKVNYFEDADKQRFGYGATIVNFK